MNEGVGAIEAPNTRLPPPRPACVLRVFFDGAQVALTTDLMRPIAPAEERAPNLALMRTPKQRNPFDQQHIRKSRGAVSLSIHPKIITPPIAPKQKLKALQLMVLRHIWQV